MSDINQASRKDEIECIQVDQIPKIKGIIFDLDGTLANTIQSIIYSVEHVFGERQITPPTYEQYRSIFGYGARNFGKDAFALTGHKLTAEEAEEVYQRYMYYFDQFCCHQVEVYPRLPQALLELQNQGVKMAVLSNKPDVQAKKVVDFCFAPYGINFAVVQGLRDDLPRKPDPSVALAIAEKLQLQPQQMAFVGDGDTDVQTGINAGMLAVGVTWGFRSAEQLREHGAQIIMHSPDALEQFVRDCQNF